jgi:hypothetical protein
MLPGIFAITLFSDRVLAAVRSPSPLTLATLGAVVLAIAAGAYALRRVLQRRAAQASASAGSNPAPAA